MSEKTIDPEAVRAEHLAEVHVPWHWAYLATVLIGGTALMLAFIGWLAGN